MEREPESHWHSPKERRRHPRRETDMQLKYRRVDGNGMPQERQYSYGRVLSISEGGMFIEVDCPIQVGQKLEVYAREEGSPTGTYGSAAAVHLGTRIDLLRVGVQFETRQTV